MSRMTSIERFPSGVIDGGSPPEANWGGPLSALMQSVVSVYRGVDAPLEVNVVFHVPGRFLGNDFEGLRTGTFSRRRRILMIQVALAEWAPDDVDVHLRALLRQAVDLAEEFAYMEGMGSSILGETKTFLTVL